MPPRTPSRLDVPALIRDVKARIQQAQTRAVMSVNAELVRLYWDIGQLIAARQKDEGYGTSVIPRLARELQNELPEEKGFSERNIGRMIAFYRAYPRPETLLPEPLAKVPASKVLPEPLAKPPSSDSLLWLVPWGHHVLLMDKVKDLDHRAWYMNATLVNGWSGPVLLAMIQSEAHRRTGKAITNFKRLLPDPQSDLVQQTLKDPYVFDFLTLGDKFHERELETGLLEHLQKFLLELGQGFAFVGRQVKLDVGGEDFYVDLLFYHLHLRRYVVIDLKRGKFKPEYAGKMNFYLSVIDDQMRRGDDVASIGIILCQDRNHIVAEYALRGVDKPIGVSGYGLTRALPKDLKSLLPTVEQIEAELAEPAPTSAAKTTPAKRKPRRRR